MTFVSLRRLELGLFTYFILIGLLVLLENPNGSVLPNSRQVSACLLLQKWLPIFHGIWVVKEKTG